MDWIVARYRVPWEETLAEKAEAIAVGMTVGSWTDLPDAQKPHLRRYLGETGAITRDGDAGVFEIRYPVANVRPSIASILTVVFGKLSLDGPIRLEDLVIPDSLKKQLPGPRWGIPGLRKQLGVPNRPLVMSIFKSENGRSLAEFHQLLTEQLAGGVDLVKDDEIFMADQNAPLLDRIRVARDAIQRRYDQTGQRGLYIPTLSGTPGEIMDQAHRAAEAGADGFLIAAYANGLDLLVDLRRAGIPGLLVLHPAFVGGQIQSPRRGVHPRILLGELARAAGADVVLYPSPYGSVAMPRDQSRAVATALRSPDIFPAALPGPSAGIHLGVLPQLFRDFGPDVMINAGGAIHGHPQGTEAGARALVDAAIRFEEVQQQ